MLMYTYILPQPSSKVKKEPGLKAAVESSKTNETPSYRFCNRSSSFCRVEESLEIGQANKMWEFFLKRLNDFEEGPAFGIAYLVAFVGNGGLFVFVLAHSALCKE